MRIFICLVVVVMCTIHMQFFVWSHIWIATIDVVNIFASVMLYVDTCVGLLPHTLAWNYQP